jgi:hypothetical protein
VVGLLLGGAIALGVEMRHRRVRSVAEVPALLGLPVVGVLPRPARLLSRHARRAKLRFLWPKSGTRTSRHETRDEGPAAAEAAPEPVEVVAQERSIGDIIRDTRNLEASQVERIPATSASMACVSARRPCAEDGQRRTQLSSTRWRSSSTIPLRAKSERGRCPELAVLNQPFSEQAEAFRAIRSQITAPCGCSATPGRAAAAPAVISPGAEGRQELLRRQHRRLAGRNWAGVPCSIDADLRPPARARDLPPGRPRRALGHPLRALALARHPEVYVCPGSPCCPWGSCPRTRWS